MSRIVHIVLDQKFIDNAISIFDRVPGIENEYLLVSRANKISFITARERVTVFRSLFLLLRYVLERTPDIIVLHSLFFGATLIPFVSRTATLVWVSWGHDLYKDKDEAFSSSYPIRHSLFLDETRKWKESRSAGLKSRGRATMKAFLRNVLRFHAIRRIKYVSTCLPYEYPLIRRKYPHLKNFAFDYIDKTAVESAPCSDFNILIGNSASINCNHLDIIRTFEERRLKTGKVVVPLGYAGSDGYRAAVIEAGSRVFGDNFMPLVTFMGGDEYARLLHTCGFAVMGFLRQQATKSLQLLLYQGTKIFFYRDTEIFRFFKMSGYSVFSIEDELNDSALGSLLAEEQAENNRRLASRQFNYDENLQRVGDSLMAMLAGGR